MPIDQASLIQSVYDNIFSTFIKPPTTGQPTVRSREMFLTLEWPGQQLDASQYQNPWAPQNPSGSQFATEMLSALIDAIPLLDAVYVDSGVTVEEMYEFVLGATAVPLPPGPTGEIPVNPVNTTLTNARQIYEQTKLASAMHPALSYHASSATPANWYDEAASKAWTTVTINSNQTTKSPNSSFVRMGGLNRVNDGVWKLPKTAINPSVVKQDVVNAVINPAVLTPIQVSPNILVNPRVLRPIAMGLNSPSANLVSPAVSAALQGQQISPNPVLVQRIRPELLEKIQLSTLRDQTLDQETKDLQISFRCCRVNFNRPWMLKSLLEISGWTLPGQATGSLSSGTLENNSGIFPLLPIGFIAIRDLSIRASWGKVDREIAAQATSDQGTLGFGPFALSGHYAESSKSYKSSFDGTTISAPGLQILGWINLVLPYAPTV
jgi:hypothetical protein